MHLSIVLNKTYNLPVQSHDPPLHGQKKTASPGGLLYWHWLHPMPSDTFYSSFSAVGGNCTLRGRHSPRFFPWLLYRVVRKQDKASDTHYWYKHYKDQDIQQLLSVQVYRGEFPVLHSSSSAIDTVHWIAIFLSWDCVTGRKIHNHLNPADKILWASPWGQWFVVHTHRKLLEHTRIHRKKNNTPHHSPPLWYQLNQIISQWL